MAKKCIKALLGIKRRFLYHAKITAIWVVFKLISLIAMCLVNDVLCVKNRGSFSLSAGYIKINIFSNNVNTLLKNFPLPSQHNQRDISLSRQSNSYLGYINSIRVQTYIACV